MVTNAVTLPSIAQQFDGGLAAAEADIFGTSAGPDGCLPWWLIWRLVVGDLTARWRFSANMPRRPFARGAGGRRSTSAIVEGSERQFDGSYIGKFPSTCARGVDGLQRDV